MNCLRGRGERRVGGAGGGGGGGLVVVVVGCWSGGVDGVVEAEVELEGVVMAGGVAR